MSIDDQNIGPEKFEPFNPPEEAPPRSGRGCFFWGCLITSILMILMLVGIVLTIFAVRGAIIKVLEENTDTQAAPLPEITLADADQKAVVERWDAFKADMEAGKPGEITLDSDELNVIVRHLVPEAEGKFFFQVEGDELKGKVSFPVGELAKSVLRTDKLAGRFFNGEGTFKVALVNSVLVVTMQDATANGKPVSKEVMDQLKTQNLAESLNNNPEQRELFAKLSTVEVKDGKIVLKTSATAGEEEAEATTADETAPEATSPDAMPAGEGETPAETTPPAEATPPAEEPAPPPAYSRAA
jgi:hypothetical protein